MNTVETTNRYARAIAASKRVRWDLDTDVIRGRAFERTHKFLPDGLSMLRKLAFLSDAERKFASQVQGRTYANMFGMVERSINAKVLELSQRHFFGDQVALEALVRFSDEEIKHQALFRRIEALAAETLPDGYRFAPDGNEVASVVLGKPTWSVLALTCLIELISQAHYKESIAPDDQLSDLFKDVFRFHFLEESQHAVIDELEWKAEDRRLDHAQREQGVTGLIELLAAVDGVVTAQAAADAEYFTTHAGRFFAPGEHDAIAATFVDAYRHQYVLSGVKGTRFREILASLVDEAQLQRVDASFPPIG